MTHPAPRTLTRNSHTRITLALDIVRRLDSGPRAGYHELAVVKHQIDLHDTITVTDAAVSSMVCDDERVPVDSRNLCLQAVALVRERTCVDRQVTVDLRKRIPVMGGLAGGSANAATILSMLNEFWELGLGVAELSDLGRELGMDVPFYFVGGTALDSEAGGTLQPLAGPLVLDFVLVVPSFGVSTRDAYHGLDYGVVGRDRAATAALVEAWGRGDRDGVTRHIHNDFQSSVFATHPALAAIRDDLRECGCDAAWMSGSGSTIVGLARDDAHAADVCRTMEGREGVARAMAARTLTAQ